MITNENTLEIEVISPYKVEDGILYVKNTDIDTLCELAELKLNFDYIKFELKDKDLVYRCNDITIQIEGEWAVIRDLEEVIKQWEQ